MNMEGLLACKKQFSLLSSPDFPEVQHGTDRCIRRC